MTVTRTKHVMAPKYRIAGSVVMTAYAIREVDGYEGRLHAEAPGMLNSDTVPILIPEVSS